MHLEDCLSVIVIVQTISNTLYHEKVITSARDDHGIRLDTKISVYVAAILPALLYGCESWTDYHSNIRKLDQFHMHCLCRIAHVCWQVKIPNTEVLQICGVTTDWHRSLLNVSSVSLGRSCHVHR